MWTGFLTDGLRCELLPAAMTSVCLTDDVSVVSVEGQITDQGELGFNEKMT